MLWILKPKFIFLVIWLDIYQQCGVLGWSPKQLGVVLKIGCYFVAMNEVILNLPQLCSFFPKKSWRWMCMVYGICHSCCITKWHEKLFLVKILKVTLCIISCFFSPGNEHKLLSLSKVNALGLCSNWFWWMGFYLPVGFLA